MPRAEPVLGYGSKTAAVVALRSKGYDTDAIAAHIGITSKDVVALEHSAGRTKRQLRPAEANGRTVLFPTYLLDRLGPHASKRSISPNELARRIVETAVDEEMVDAILDDAETLCP